LGSGASADDWRCPRAFALAVDGAARQRHDHGHQRGQDFEWTRWVGFV
jgi:hypothetical protein